MKNQKWSLHSSYKQQNYNQLERLHWLHDKEYIADAERKMDEESISEFVVIKLPRGGEEDHKEFRLRDNPYGLSTRGRKSDDSIDKQTDTILASREANALEFVEEEFEEDC